MTEIYHLTCRHGAEKIIADGLIVKPQAQIMLNGSAFAWFTHVPSARREALGLTSHTLNCDRSERVFHVTGADMIFRWNDIRSVLPRDAVLELESARGAKPEWWWVSKEPVTVEEVIVDHKRGKKP